MLARIQTMLDDFRRRRPRLFVAIGTLVLVALGWAAWSMRGEIPGHADAPVTSQLGALPQSCGGRHEMAQHPDLLIDASFERIDIGFNDGVTVGEANAALEAAGVRVIGANASVGTVCGRVRGADPDFVAMDRALESLDHDPAVKYASMNAAHSIDPPIMQNVQF